MINPALHQLRDALSRRADNVQRDFNRVGEELKALSRRFFEYGADELALTAEQEKLHAHQNALAQEINLWRARAHQATHTYDHDDLRAFLEAMLALEDEAVRAAAESALYLLNAPAAGEATPAAGALRPSAPATPAGRLLERARTECDLRGPDPTPRQRAAVEFANRPGLGQDEAVLAHLEAAQEETDPYTREVIALTLIQLYRFRAMRMADLEKVEQAVKWLTQCEHTAVIPVLSEILGNARGGFTQTAQLSNRRFRLMALDRLVWWHTPQAQAALRAHIMDRDPHISQTARRALSDYRGEWQGRTTG